MMEDFFESHETKESVLFSGSIEDSPSPKDLSKEEEDEEEAVDGPPVRAESGSSIRGLATRGAESRTDWEEVRSSSAEELGSGRRERGWLRVGWEAGAVTALDSAA